MKKKINHEAINQDKWTGSYGAGVTTRQVRRQRQMASLIAVLMALLGGFVLAQAVYAAEDETALTEPENDKVTVTVQTNGHGTVDGQRTKTERKVIPGTDLHLDLLADENYVIDSVLVNGEEAEPEDLEELPGSRSGCLTVEQVEDDLELKAVFLTREDHLAAAAARAVRQSQAAAEEVTGDLSEAAGDLTGVNDDEGVGTGETASASAGAEDGRQDGDDTADSADTSQDPSTGDRTEKSESSIDDEDEIAGSGDDDGDTDANEFDGDSGGADPSEGDDTNAPDDSTDGDGRTGETTGDSTDGNGRAGETTADNDDGDSSAEEKSSGSEDSDVDEGNDADDSTDGSDGSNDDKSPMDDASNPEAAGVTDSGADPAGADSSGDENAAADDKTDSDPAAATVTGDETSASLVIDDGGGDTAGSKTGQDLQELTVEKATAKETDENDAGGSDEDTGSAGKGSGSAEETDSVPQTGDTVPVFCLLLLMASLTLPGILLCRRSFSAGAARRK